MEFANTKKPCDQASFIMVVALIGDWEGNLCHHGYGYFYYTALLNNAARQQEKNLP
jgi:hypothetical protein